MHDVPLEDSCIPFSIHGPLPKACLEEVRSLHECGCEAPELRKVRWRRYCDGIVAQLRQMCEDTEDRASNAQKEARQKRKEALEEVVQQIYHNNKTKEIQPRIQLSQNKDANTRNSVHHALNASVEGDRVKFALGNARMALLSEKFASLENGSQATGKMIVEFKGKSTKSIPLSYNDSKNSFLFCPKMVTQRGPVCLERYIEGLPFDGPWLGETSGDKRKWNGNIYNHNPTTQTTLATSKLEQMPDRDCKGVVQLARTLRYKDAEPHRVPQAKRGPEAKEAGK
ncbi:hypothetical protein Tco_1352933 [Tanacetum coccineum]